MLKNLQKRRKNLIIKNKKEFNAETGEGAEFFFDRINRIDRIIKRKKPQNTEKEGYR